MVIGISTRLDGKTIKVNRSIIDKIKDYDVQILLILPQYSANIDNFLNICSGFIIPGGVSWHATDEVIIKHAIKNDVPLLGICAGMQAIANINNFVGSEESDKTIPIEEDNHHNLSEYVHDVDIINPFLENIIGQKKIKVNSRHHFKVLKEDYFIVDALSPDGIIEAIHIPKKKFIVGIQWHPEDLKDAYSYKIFESFITSCQKD